MSSSESFRYKVKLGPFLQGPAQLNGVMPVCVNTLPGGVASLRTDHIPAYMIDWARHPPLLHSVKVEYKKFSPTCQQCCRNEEEEGGIKANMEYPCPVCELLIHRICAVVCEFCQTGLLTISRNRGAAPVALRPSPRVRRAAPKTKIMMFFWNHCRTFVF